MRVKQWPIVLMSMCMLVMWDVSVNGTLVAQESPTTTTKLAIVDVAANCEQNEEGDVHLAIDAIDQNLHPDSRWSCDEPRAHITLDLGSVHFVKNVKVVFYKATTRVAYADVEISKECSAIPCRGTKVLEIASDGQTAGFQSFALEKEARYITIVGVRNTQEGYETWTSFVEFELEGSSLPPTPPSPPTPQDVTVCGDWVAPISGSLSVGTIPSGSVILRYVFGDHTFSVHVGLHGLDDTLAYDVCLTDGSGFQHVLTEERKVTSSGGNAELVQEHPLGHGGHFVDKCNGRLTVHVWKEGGHACDSLSEGSLVLETEYLRTRNVELGR